MVWRRAARLVRHRTRQVHHHGPVGRRLRLHFLAYLLSRHVQDHRLEQPGVPQRRHAQRTVAAARPSLARSEEHTSELQSLMRISYAVFCLKKKKDRSKLQLPTTHITY